MNPAIISKIIIKRFRSFPAATLSFENPLFVVGRNGSGKSNLADVFSFVSEAMVSPLQAVFDRRGGIASVRNRSSVKSAPPILGLAFEFGPFNGTEGGRFAFEVKALPNYGYKVVREQCLVRKKDGGRWWFDRGDDWKSNADGLTPALEPTSLALPLVGGDERFAPIFRILGGMRVYAIEPAKLRDMQDPDSGQTLRPDGSNAASVLQELLRGDDDAAKRHCRPQSELHCTRLRQRARPIEHDSWPYPFAKRRGKTQQGRGIGKRAREARTCDMPVKLTQLPLDAARAFGIGKMRG